MDVNAFSYTTSIQNLVFPKGIVINPKNRQYRTEKNFLGFKANTEISRIVEEGKEKRQPISQLPSSVVASEIGLSNQFEEDLIAVYKLAIFLKKQKNK